MPEDGINGKSEDRIRRALKKLPPAKAAPDFEARLHRRIGEIEGEKSGAPAPIGFFPRRVPALGYSLVALVLVGIVSYYMFWRTGVVPVSVPGNNPPPPSASSENAKQLPPASNGQVQSEKSAEAPSPFRDETARKKSVETPGADKRVHEERRAASRDDRSHEVTGTAAQQAAPSIAPPESKLKEGAPLKSNAKYGVQNIEIQQNYRQEGPKAQSQVPQLKGVQAAPAPSARSEDALHYLYTPREFSAAAVSDTSAIRDSLYIDSLKRALKTLDSLHKATKKPPE